MSSSSFILKEIGKNINLTMEDIEQYNQESKNKKLNITTMPDLVDIYGLVVDGYDETLFEDIQKKKIPIDAWGFRQWEQLWRDIYVFSFQKSYPYNHQQFNNVFSDFMQEVKDGYSLSNEEVAKYLYWLSKSYLKYLNKYNKPFNFRTIKYKLGEFYTSEIKTIDSKQEACGKRLRDLPIDPKNIKGSIDAEYEKNCDVLLRQLGFPVMLYYNWKWVFEGDKEKSINSLVNCIKERCKFEKNNNRSYEEYLSQIIYNSIYFGPYPFEKKLLKEGLDVCCWKEIFSKFIEMNNIKNKHWWMNCYLERDPLECMKIFNRKKRIRKID